jgi:hypothetical protein
MVVIAECMHDRIDEEFVIAHEENPRDTDHLSVRPSASSQTSHALASSTGSKFAVVPVP